MLVNIFVTDNKKPKRKNSLRKPDTDYTQSGSYFVTICTQKRRYSLGSIHQATMYQSQLGQLAQKYWQQIPVHYSTVRLDDFVVMPNHLHGLVVLDDSPNIKNPHIGVIVASFKRAMTMAAIKNKLDFVRPIWQRGYHDRIVRTVREYNNLKNYINTNPERWEMDTYF